MTTTLDDHGVAPHPGGAGRLLFVSSVTDGGSGRSQRELARSLRDRGRDVRFLVEDTASTGMRRRALGELTDAAVRFRSGRLGPPMDALRRRIGAATATVEIEGLPHEMTLAPENAFEATIRRWRPDVVVVSSISRVTWRAVRAACRRRGLPTALHLREAPAIGHLTAGLHPDLLLANSGTLVEDAQRLGHHAALVPSVVRVAPMTLPPSGDVLLLVNPIRTHGLDVIGPLAAARPDIPIVLQESWTLDRDARSDVDRLVRDHANVTFRAFDPRPGMLFRDAKVLLAPHRVDNRPRTILEAQTNGLPVIATDLAGLVESTGGGGVTVGADEGPDAWIAAVARMWDDRSAWMNASDAARIHAGRPEVRPERVADRFCELIDALVAADDEGQNSSMSPSANRN